MMRRSTQPDQQRAAAEVLRNSGHPLAITASTQSRSVQVGHIGQPGSHVDNRLTQFLIWKDARHRHVERVGELVHVRERDILFATLDDAHVGSVHSDSVGTFLLAQSARRATRAHVHRTAASIGLTGPTRSWQP